MKGKVFMDWMNDLQNYVEAIRNSDDAELNEFVEWMNDHRNSDEFTISFDGRYVVVKFKPKKSNS